ncbi:MULTISPECIES: LysR family transcriptional regulator [Sphingomonas]|jgi:DNA-binding transcriptional LysR family regulator|uniref:LysR family transcriptional regulator n=1 Tax=Sphingomonas TaxID=13687 RepID=UPI000831CE89|nr:MULTISPECIES: LysR family transcriptional regulator [Sphingomonas]MBY0300442.1 LysR family transcriptional regulator [Sphingomonas ginsenosidimutans]
MTQPVPWNDLQDFLAIARSGQLARAAAAMGVDATTIGRRLRRLEARLGRTLFEQTREGQVLTEAGEALLAQVERMARAADAIASDGAAGTLTGVLRVSVSEGFGAFFVARHLPAFASEHPGLTVDLVASSGFLSPSRREADVAVLLARPRSGPLVAAKLSDYALHLYAARDYLTRHPPPTRATLGTAHRLVGYIPDLLYAPELRYLDDIDARLVPHLRSSSIQAQARLIESGAGIGVLPHFIAGANPALVRVLPDISIRRAFWLVTHRDTRRLARVRVFRAWLADLVARHRAELLG